MKLTRLTIGALAAAAILASGSMALAQQPGGQPARIPPRFLPALSVTLFPNGDVYSVYAADPHRPTNGVSESFTIGGSIPDTDSPLTQVATGGRFGVVRFGPATPGGRAWQLSIEAGFDALFDSQNKLDVVGWDGNYGLTVTTASSSPLAWKFAMLHISSHIGDEYQARTGRERVNYTREELSVGAAWRWSPNWRAYGETGVAYYRGDPALEPWRIQSGVEYRIGPRPLQPALRVLRRGRHLVHAGAGLASGQDRQCRDRHTECGTHVPALSRMARRPSNRERILQRHDSDPQSGSQGRFVAMRRLAV